MCSQVILDMDATTLDSIADLVLDNMVNQGHLPFASREKVLKYLCYSYRKNLLEVIQFSVNGHLKIGHDTNLHLSVQGRAAASPQASVREDEAPQGEWQHVPAASDPQPCGDRQEPFLKQKYVGVHVEGRLRLLGVSLTNSCGVCWGWGSLGW